MLKTKTLQIALILLLISLGAVLRFYQLSAQSYWMDEGYTVNAVMSVLEHGSTVLDSGQYYSCPTYCYPTALLAKIFGPSPLSYRLLSVLAGLIFILAIFFITRKLFDKNTALLSAFFVTFSYWQIAWSRQARWYTLFSLFFWLALYFFYQALYSDKNKYRNIILAAGLTALASLTHGLGYLLPLIFLGWIIWEKARKLSLIFIPLGLLSLYLLNFELHYELPYYLSFYLRNYWLFIIFAVLAFFNRNENNKRPIHFLLFTLLAYLVPLSFLTNIVHYRYLFHLTPVFFILGSIGLLNISQTLKNKTHQVAFWLLILVFFATIAGGVFLPQANYYLESDNPETFSLGNRPHYASTPQPNWQEAYTYIKNNKKENDVIISSHPHFNKIFLHQAGYWLKYNYLGFNNKPNSSLDDREYYVGALIIDDLDELKTITNSHHGFIIFDLMAADKSRIDNKIIDYIKTKYYLAFHDKINFYSEIWVYRF